MPEMLTCRCPACQALLKLKDPAVVGKKIRCPKCSEAFVVQALDSAEPKAPPPAAIQDPGEPAEQPGTESRRDGLSSLRPMREAPEPEPVERVSKKKGGVIVPLAALLVVAAYLALAVAFQLHWIGSQPPEPHTLPAMRSRTDNRIPDNHIPNADNRKQVEEVETVMPVVDAGALEAGRKKIAATQQAETALIEDIRRNESIARPSHLELLTLYPESENRFARWASAVAFAPDSTLLASVHGDGVVTLWDLRTGKVQRSLGEPDKDARIACVAFSPDGATLAVAQDRFGIRLWDVKTSHLRHTIAFPADAQPESLAFSPDGSLLMSCGRRDVRIWDPATGREAVSLPPIRCDSSRGFPAFRPDGKVLAAYDRDANQVRFLNLATGKTFHHGFPVPNNGRLAFTPDGTSLVVSQGADELRGDGTRLHVLDVPTLTSTVVATGELTGALAMSPDGLLAYCDKDAPDKWSICLYDVSRKTVRRRLGKPHTGATGILAFSSGGLLLASANLDGITIWNTSDLLNDPLFDALDRMKSFAEIRRNTTGLTAELQQQATDADLAVVARLPGLTELRADFNDPISDAGVAHLGAVSNLRGLDLGGCNKVTDAGLAPLKRLTRLERLRLPRSFSITDASLAPLDDLVEMQVLDVSCTHVTGAGLSHLRKMKNLRVLKLFNTAVGEGGLADIKGLIGLTELDLMASHITDKDLGYLEGLRALEDLKLSDNDLSDAGRAHLEGLTKMRRLELDKTRAGDATLQRLVGMTQLQRLNLNDTRITDAGFEHLAGLTQLESLEFSRVDAFKGPGLRHLARLDRLTRLALQYTKVTDEGLAGLKDLNQLKELSVPSTTSDAGLEHLAGLTNLTDLTNLTGFLRDDMPNLIGPGLRHLKGLRKMDLRRTGVTDAGLVGVKDLKQLEELWLPSRITDAGLVHVSGLTSLKQLNLQEAPVTDEGLKQLHGLKKLSIIDLEKTKVTPAGVAALKKAILEVYVSGAPK
jgi:Leucine-rich repeat (LRR) protein